MLSNGKIEHILINTKFCTKNKMIYFLFLFKAGDLAGVNSTFQIQVDDDEVLVLSFMEIESDEDSFSNMIMDREKVIYVYKGALTTTGSPVNQFSICSWLKLNRHQSSDFILSIQPITMPTDGDDHSTFEFLSFGSKYGSFLNIIVS